MLSENDGLTSTEMLVDQQKIVMWETLAQYTTPEIQRVVEFAKRIPSNYSISVIIFTVHHL